MDARELKDKATAALAGRKFGKAAELLEEYCKLDPKDLQSRLRCGDAWSKAGKKDKAVIAYAGAAEGFAREGFLPRAIAASKLVLELDPAHKGVQKMLADLYARKSSSPSRLSKPPPTPADLPELAEPVITHGVEQPEQPAQPFQHSKGAIDLEPQVVRDPNKGPPAPVAPPLPGPLGLPPLELPIEGATPSVERQVPPPEPEPEPAAIEIELDTPVAEGVEIEVPIQGQLIEESPAPTGLDPAVLAVLKPPMELPPPKSGFIELDPSPLPQPAPSGSTFELQVELKPAPPPEAPPAAQAPPPPPPDAAPPPGLRPRASLALDDPPAGYQSSPSRIRLPAAFGGPKPTLTPAEPLPALVRPAESELARSLNALTTAPPAPAAGLAASFTELELEGDSLLHAVEAAARPDGAPPAAEELLEPVEEARPDPNSLPRIPLFSDLPEDAFIALFERCPLRRFEDGARIIEQGQKGDAFYVICSGRVRVFRTDRGQRNDLASLEEGAFFGEVALLSDSPRTASVEAAGEDTQLLEISAAILTELSSKHPTVAQALKKFCRQRLLANLMASAPLFRPFSRSDRRDLIQRFRAREVRTGELVVKEGTDADGLYVVLSGEVEVRVKGAAVASLREGEIFGEMSLLTKTPAAATVVSRRHTSLLRLPRADFDALVLSHPQILEHVADLTDERRRSNQHLV